MAELGRLLDLIWSLATNAVFWGVFAAIAIGLALLLRILFDAIMRGRP